MARILIVEDSQGTIFGYEEFLGRELGHALTICRSSQEVLERFHPAKFDLIIADGHLPDGYGWEIIAALRRRGEKLPPIIAVTASPQTNQTPQRWKDAGVHQVLAKPVTDWLPLQQEVSHLLAGQPAAQ